MAKVAHSSEVDCGTCSWTTSMTCFCCRRKSKDGAEEAAEKHEVKEESKTRMNEVIFMVCELAVVLLYITCTDYVGIGGVGQFDVNQDEIQDKQQSMQSYYPMWQDVHIMIYIGFGFLMVFLKTGSWTAVGFNFMLSAWAFQISILAAGFWHQLFEGHFQRINLNITSLIVGDFGAGCCMITFGALLGKADLFQLWILVTLEIIVYTLNEAIGVFYYQAVDIGGSMFIHTFGAYFGLAASYWFQSKKAIEKQDQCAGGYTSQTVAMVGTVFLFMFWPSFNSAFAPALSQQRVVVNTTLSITASVIGACGFSRLMESKLDMEVVLNATLAGGVIIGAASDIVVAPGVAIIIGGFGGMVSAAGFMMLSGYLRDKIGMHDTCGVHNLHGLPGVLGGLSGVITTSLAGTLYANTDDGAVTVVFTAIGEGRTFSTQAKFQFFTLLTSLGISLVGGFICGWIASKFGRPPKSLYDDCENWMHVCKDRKDKNVHEDGAHCHDKHNENEPTGFRNTSLN